ncbi:MobA/MobL family protein [Caenibacillus caldisaponilyticus]|uniref:MobA/MobL family protein n=1 Tax=Caenibacillus caldisaponilyticus TaxID=1674942 RepID=UPI0013015FAF|nr:MobA/MobL family protein [Caenibacillus caldisaponilyticus]
MPDPDRPKTILSGMPITPFRKLSFYYRTAESQQTTDRNQRTSRARGSLDRSFRRRRPRTGTISSNRASLSLHGSPFSFYPACPPKKRITEATREISEEGFTVKNQDWNNRELLNEWREEWANYANRALGHAGIEERITHLSHEARGLEILPTVHLGHVAHEMEMRGIQTDRGNINRERQEYNRVVLDLHKYREEKKALEEKQQQERSARRANGFSFRKHLSI